MSSSKHIGKITAIAVVLALVITLIFMNGAAFGIQTADTAPAYAQKLFDTSRVHTIDIVMEDFEGFLETCQSEEYSLCQAIIDGEAFSGVGIRGKGNTSLSTVASMDSDRYSFKLEFDQYDSAKSYYGLDKLSLNNLIQDNTMMKDYLTYRMMAEFGVAAPLTSFVYITVNGEDWGLYLAVEAVEESFLERNYGSGYGDLYKPDSMELGGGRGNGREFDMDAVFGEEGEFALENLTEFGNRGGMGGGMGSSETKLQYIDDNPESYSTIFESAKTDVTDTDKTRLIAALKALSEGNTDGVAVEDVMRYFVVHNFVVNGDSYTGSMVHNYYLYERDGKLAMIPWDYNLAFGTFQGNSASQAVNDDVDSPLSATGNGDRPMMDWILGSEETLGAYHSLFTEFLENVDPLGLIAEAKELITPYVEDDPTKFCTTEEFEAGVEALKAFCQLRRESVSRQLAGEDTPVETGDLNLSDMGTMDRGNMGGGQMTRPETQPETEATLPEGMTPPDGEMTMPEGGMNFPGGNTTMPEGGMNFPDGNMTMPEGGMTFPGEEGTMPSFGGGGRGGMTKPEGNMTPPDGAELPREMEGIASASGGNGGVAAVLIVCAAVLLAGLLFARGYKRRKI